uniref:DUF4219 domain-containing protein n=1 Tax=Lepeophtheirus salmonis TaxID=72036 RepID=A0A0K2UHD7_LEPSM
MNPLSVDRMSIAPLKGSKYPTWKIQCRMALMKENLWKIVKEEEMEPKITNANLTEHVAIRISKDEALAIIVSAIDTKPTILSR